MAETCVHGVAAPDCLICKTLGMGPAGASQATGTDTGRRGRRRADIPAPTPVEVLPPGQGPRQGRRRSIGADVALVALGILVFLFAGWFVLAALRGVLHLIELAAVAVVAGWLGYRLGHFSGRHQGD